MRSRLLTSFSLSCTLRLRSSDCRDTFNPWSTENMAASGTGEWAAKPQFTEMSVSYWNTRWEVGKTGFHKNHLNPLLQKFQDQLLGGRKNIRIFFPLCGKALDMKYFADQGHQVVGVEGSQKAIKEFFSEQGLEYTTEPAKGMTATLYKSKDNKLHLYEGDFFAFNPSVEGQFDAVWDYGALVAINRPDRERYAALMLSLMAPGCSYLLSTVIYDETKYSGPPHYVSEEQVHQLYGKFNGLQCGGGERCKIETLGEVDSFEPGKHEAWNITSLVEKIYKVTLK